MEKYTVTVSWDQNLDDYITLDTGIDSEQTQKLSTFTSFTKTETTMETLASNPAISTTYHFSFHPTGTYNGINDKDAYGALKTAITNGTMNFTASFATTTTE